MSVELLKETIKRELPGLLRDDPALRAYILELTPAKKLRLVQAWMAIHEEELIADWALAVNGEPVFPIDPLR